MVTPEAMLENRGGHQDISPRLSSPAAQSPSGGCSDCSSQDLRGRGDVTAVNESSMVFSGVWVPLGQRYLADSGTRSPAQGF